ncbi:MAG: sigma-70 family RNA polymerase sigma factor, partial [Eubacteriales bacterium]
RIEVSLYDSIGVDKEGNEITLIDVLGTDAEVVTDLVESAFEQRRLMEKIRHLNSREKNVLELRFGLMNGMRKTQKEIARKLGISRSYVSRIEKRALHKLIKDFKAEGC